MLCPSPMGWNNQLEEYGRKFAYYFKDREKGLKQHDIICFVQNGFNPAEIRTCTGYSLDFIHDTVRRFAAACNVKLLKTIKERFQEENNVPSKRSRTPNRKS